MSKKTAAMIGNDVSGRAEDPNDDMMNIHCAPDDHCEHSHRQSKKVDIEEGYRAHILMADNSQQSELGIAEKVAYRSGWPLCCSPHWKYLEGWGSIKRDNTLEQCKESIYGQQMKFDGSRRENGQLTMTGYGKSPTPAVHDLGLTWQCVDPR
ncbi:hypothetical protein B0H14DRAFT_2931784 [Mycena olivaceomarginata]|nr:hypothetical protein B0H14DRAFT_2931784 [Mycena olivaceomarginata]